jgi:anti-sigma regulatory factor (Ser/Thr protein kinase)
MTTPSPKRTGRTDRTELIRRFLLNAITAGNATFLHDAMATFHLSRQAIHQHLSALVGSGHLVAVGNTRARTYAPGPTRTHAAVFPLQGLKESDVYYRDFGFVFKDLPKEIEDTCHYGFTEMLNNAIDHAGGQQVKVAVERTATDISIRIDDDGEGIFKHIARIIGLADPREAILELSKGKLTTDPDKHSGQGIFFTSRAFDHFSIFSGDLIFSHNDGESNDWLLHNDADTSGTKVMMRIALACERTLRSVFDAYTGSEDEDFAFNKTVVPVKLVLYQGERLVSRAQAKRILNRVEKFSTVWLDFDGVDAIGQGFADEVFRVFARRNPQVKLEPINMNDAVRRMVRAAQQNPDAARPLPDAGKPLAFVSYARADDAHDNGLISAFCQRLAGEARLQSGEEFAIFQDRNDIAWGQQWQQRLDDAPGALTFLIPIMTPSFFNNAACRAELERFLALEKSLGRNDLIVPVYYVKAAVLDDPAKRSKDHLAQLLHSRNMIDWRGLRFAPLNSQESSMMLARMVEDYIVAAMERKHAGAETETGAETKTTPVVAR